MTINDLKADKPNLVLIHGWGMNSEIWQGVAPILSQHFTLHSLNLPGFGGSADLVDYSLENVSLRLMQQMPAKAIVLGWSLGGLVASDIAIRAPERVSTLVTVASSPCFVQQGNWPGMQPRVLEQFAKGLSLNFKRTLQQFMAIQAMGSPHAKEDIKQLRTWVEAQPLPSQSTLENSLKLLASSDLRCLWQGIDIPFVQFFGRKDSLVPRDAIAEIALCNPQAKQHVFRDASHAPFISDPESFCEALVAQVLA